MNPRHVGVVLLLTLVSLVSAPEARGQVAEPPVAADDGYDDFQPGTVERDTPAEEVRGRPAALVEEIVVRAQKRDESLLEVPVAVSAIGSEALDNEFINDLDQIQRLVPSLTIVGDDVRIRGVGTGGFALQVEPSVAFSIDGVVLARSNQAFLQMVDVERVEVLRGPQGTLFGKNASAGLVQVITRPPAEEYEATGEFQWQQEDEYVVKGSVSGPITDDIGARLSGMYTYNGGFTPNPSVDYDRNGGESFLIRGKVVADPTPDLNILLTGFVQKSDSNAPDFMFREVTDPALNYIMSGLGVTPSPENGTATSDGSGFSDTTDWGGWADIDWTLAQDHVLTSQTAYMSRDGRSRDDVDEQPIPIRDPIFFTPDVSAFGTVGPINFQQSGTNDIWQVSQEFRLTSPAEDDFSYIVGVYGQYFEINDRLRRDFDVCVSPAAVIGGDPGPINPNLVPGQPCVDPTFSVTSLSNLSGFLGLPPIDGEPALTIAEVERNVKTQSYAVFGQATYQLAQNWEVLGGVRVQYDDVEGGFDVTVPNPVPNFGFGEGPGLSGSINGVGAGGKFALQYFFWDDVMTYASYARGYKGPTGTFEGDAFVKVDPETSNNYEIGLKSPVFGGRGYVSLIGFWSDFQNFQEEQFSDIEKTFILSNVGEVRTRGFEFESQVFPVEGWTLYGSAAFVDAKIRDFENGPCYAPPSSDPDCMITVLPDGTTSTTKDLSGATLPNSPNWKFYVMSRYDRDIPNTDLYGYVQASYAYQDNVQFDLAQNPRTVLPAFGRLDASIGLGGWDGRVLVSFYARNLTNQNFANVLFQDFVTGFSPNIIQFRPNLAQRRFGVSVRVAL